MASMPTRCWSGLAGCLVFLSTIFSAWADAGSTKPDWPLWQQFVQQFVQADGRVIEKSASGRTTSEAQAYGLFFALVANDRDRFNQILNWTRNNLAGGDLVRNLPAWEWGRRGNASWGVLDTNAASDADLWLGYTLLEAGRLWQAQGYEGLGRAVLANVRSREVANLPGLGPLLLPGPYGFVKASDHYILNPSYLPLQVLTRFGHLDPSGPWRLIAANTIRLILLSSPKGFVPDWIAYHPSGGFQIVPGQGPIGSFDAIRTYLWIGMLPAHTRALPALLQGTRGMAAAIRRTPVPPQRVNVLTAEVKGDGPIGFSAALIPYLQKLHDQRAVQQQVAHIYQYLRAGKPVTYYDHSLILFGLGWQQHRFRFDSHGSLKTTWEKNTNGQ
jgi:endoglucanase